MSTVTTRVSLSTLASAKDEYVKAGSTLENEIANMRKVLNTLPQDAMLKDLRNSLTQLIQIMEARQAVIKIMADAMKYATEGYQNSQKKAVKKSNEFKAHKQDFYGNPVKVAAVAGGGAAALAGSVTATASASSSGGGASASASASSSVSTTTTETTTTTTTTNTTVINNTYVINEAPESPVGGAVPVGMISGAGEAAAAIGAATASKGMGAGGVAGIAAGAAALGAAAGVAGTVLAGKKKGSKETEEDAVFVGENLSEDEKAINEQIAEIKEAKANQKARNEELKSIQDKIDEMKKNLEEME